jgi:hypothetical protein
MDSQTLNFIGPISRKKFLKKMKAKTLGKDWEKLTLQMPEKTK